MTRVSPTEFPAEAAPRNWAIDRLIDGDFPTPIRAAALVTLAAGAAIWSFGIEAPIYTLRESLENRK